MCHLKYSYFCHQLFDKDNYLNRHSSQYMFSTEGHVFPVHKMFRTKPWLQSQDEENDDKLSRKSSASVAFVKSSSASEEDESTTCDSGLEESGNVPVTSRQQLDQDVIVYSTASNITHSVSLNGYALYCILELWMTNILCKKCRQE